MCHYIFCSSSYYFLHVIFMLFKELAIKFWCLFMWRRSPKNKCSFDYKSNGFALLTNVVFHAFVHLSFALNYNAMHISFILSPLVKGLCNYLMGTNYSSKAKRLKIDMCPHTPKIRLTLLEARLPSRWNLKTDEAFVIPN